MTRWYKRRNERRIKRLVGIEGEMKERKRDCLVKKEKRDWLGKKEKRDCLIKKEKRDWLVKKGKETG